MGGWPFAAVKYLFPPVRVAGAHPVDPPLGMAQPTGLRLLDRCSKQVSTPQEIAQNRVDQPPGAGLRDECGGFNRLMHNGMCRLRPIEQLA